MDPIIAVYVVKLTVRATDVGEKAGSTPVTNDVVGAACEQALVDAFGASRAGNYVTVNATSVEQVDE